MAPDLLMSRWRLLISFFDAKLHPDVLHLLCNSIAPKGVATCFVKGMSLINVVWDVRFELAGLLDRTSLHC